MGKKPLKIEDGRIKEMGSSDDLPNQPDIEELRELLAVLVQELMEIGLEFNDKRLLTLLNK